MNISKGKILNWLIFIVVIIILLGSLFYLQSRTKVPGSSQTIEEKTIVTQPRKQFAVPEVSENEKQNQDNDAFNQALLSGTGCEKIKFNDELKQLCLDTLAFNEARDKQDEKICATIADANLKTKCYDQVYLDLGVKGMDKNFCEKITDTTIKQNCLDKILAFSGGTLKSAADCSSISDAVLKQTCINNFYYQDSLNKTDAKSCGNITDADLQKRCVETVQKSIQINEAIKNQSSATYQSNEEKLKNCDSLDAKSSSICKDQANFNLAAEKKDLDYCKNITDSAMQANCIQTQSVTINNYYLKQAIRLKDSSLCQKILDSALMSTCLSSF